MSCRKVKVKVATKKHTSGMNRGSLAAKLSAVAWQPLQINVRQR